MLTGKFFKNRDNSLFLKLSTNGAAVLVSAVTKIEFVGALGTVNSLSGNAIVADAGAGGWTVNLGISSLPVGEHKLKLIVYSNDYTRGIVWDTALFEIVDG